MQDMHQITNPDEMMITVRTPDHTGHAVKKKKRKQVCVEITDAHLVIDHKTKQLIDKDVIGTVVNGHVVDDVDVLPRPGGG